MKKGVPCFLFVCMLAVCAQLLPGQVGIPDRRADLEELAVRYGLEAWPGKNGPVVAGIKGEELFRSGTPLVRDHEDWLQVDDEWVLVRQFACSDRAFVVDLAVARTCRTAQEVLFSHLTRQSAMKPLDPPALPCGRVRLRDIGDVCFALPPNGKETFHSVEFVRNNVVVLLKTLDDTAGDLRKIAAVIDEHITSQSLFPDWQSTGLWISIDRFEVKDVQVESGSITPILVTITDPRNETVVKAWELSSGGILEENGQVSFNAEGSGRQTITLLVANSSGLAASARTELEVLK